MLARVLLARLLLVSGCACCAALHLPTPPRTPRHPPVCASQRLFRQRPLEVGAEWDGLVTKITDFGAFVRLGHEQHMGLLHISDLSQERLERENVPEYVEESVGPVGSKVRVSVSSLEYRGRPRVSLKLLSVIQKQQMEDLVFSSPRRNRAGHEQAASTAGDPMRGSARLLDGIARLRDLGFAADDASERALISSDGDVMAAVMELSREEEEEEEEEEGIEWDFST